MGWVPKTAVSGSKIRTGGPISGVRMLFCVSNPTDLGGAKAPKTTTPKTRFFSS